MDESGLDKLTHLALWYGFPFSAQPEYFVNQETRTTLVWLHGSHDCSPVRSTHGRGGL